MYKGPLIHSLLCSEFVELTLNLVPIELLKAAFSNLRGQKLRTFQSKAAYLFGKSSAVFGEKERTFWEKQRTFLWVFRHVVLGCNV